VGNYHPSIPETAAALETVCRAAPQFLPYAGAGGEILHAGALRWTGKGAAAAWCCPCAENGAQAEGAAALRVAFAGCTCAGDAGAACAACAHRLALLAYRTVCRRQLHARLLGDLRDNEARARAHAAANGGLLVFRQRPGAPWPLLAWMDASYAAPSPICQVQAAGEELDFATEADLAAFARWLGGAHALRAPAEGSLACAACAHGTPFVARTLARALGGGFCPPAHGRG
jgi:hypothetical protein